MNTNEATREKLKLTVKPQRNMFGKLSGKYTATMLGAEQTADTREQATNALYEMLDNVMRHAFARRYLVANDGTVFSLYHVPGGWAYDIIHTSVPGALSPGSCGMGESYVNAYDAMKRHFEQYNADLPQLAVAQA